MASSSPDIACQKCQKTLKNIRDLFKHRSQQCKPKQCPTCFQTFARAEHLYSHINKKKKHKCHHCSKVFCDRDTYEKHLRSLKDITDQSIRNLNQRIYPETGYEGEDGYQEVIENKFRDIRDRTKETKFYKVYNKQIDPSFKYSEINHFLLDLYAKHTNGFKINLGLGYVLYHTISEIYKYHYVSTNNLLFEKAVPITCRKDISDLMNHIISLDLSTTTT